jgi:hypothetical protein
MTLELALLPLAFAAVAYCAHKTLRKFPDGIAPRIWVLGFFALGLVAIMTVLPSLQE